MITLTDRQTAILRRVLDWYADAAEPVASAAIAAELGVSPATVRIEYAALDEAGLLATPHTSAGRVPTARAWRWLVDQLAVPDSGVFNDDQEGLSLLDEEERASWNRCRDEIAAAGTDHALRFAARNLSAVSGLAVAAVRGGDSYYYTGWSQLLEQPEFSDGDRSRELAAALDGMERALAQFAVAPEGDFLPLRFVIGKEFFPTDAFGALVSSFGPESRLVLFGPARMRYPAQAERMLRARELLLPF